MIIISSFKRALHVSVKEWIYFLFLGISIYFNWNVFYLKNSLAENYKILAYFLSALSAFISMFLFFSFAGRVSRHTYDLESYPYIVNLKQSLKATALFIAYSTIMAIIGNKIMVLLPNLVLRFVFFVITYSLTFSFILEILKVFFLEKEVFSLYEVFNRIISLRYWISFFVIIAITGAIQVIQSYLFNSLLNPSTTSGFLIHVFALLRSFIFGYLLILSLVFFILIFDLKNDTKFENVEISI